MANSRVLLQPVLVANVSSLLSAPFKRHYDNKGLPGAVLQLFSDRVGLLGGSGMKLELSRLVQGGGRLGVLKGLGRTKQLSMEVPGCLLYTHLGSVPHLTQDTLQTLSNLPSVTQVSLSNMWVQPSLHTHRHTHTGLSLRSNLHLHLPPAEQSTRRCWRTLRMDSGSLQVLWLSHTFN